MWTNNTSLTATPKINCLMPLSSALHICRWCSLQIHLATTKPSVMIWINYQWHFGVFCGIDKSSVQTYGTQFDLGYHCFTEKIHTQSNAHIQRWRHRFTCFCVYTSSIVIYVRISASRYLKATAIAILVQTNVQTSPLLFDRTLEQQFTNNKWKFLFAPWHMCIIHAIMS